MEYIYCITRSINITHQGVFVVTEYKNYIPQLTLNIRMTYHSVEILHISNYKSLITYNQNSGNFSSI